MTARLAYMLALRLGWTCDRFAIGNLRASHICLHFELAEHTIHNYFQMQLTHTADDCLTAVQVGMQPEGRILFCQLPQGNRHLILVSACPWLNCNFDHG